MLAKRIIPCLDINKGRVVKGVNFINLIDAGDPVEIAKKYSDEGADEITFLDITASNEERNIIINTVARKEKCKTRIEYRVSGEAFYTKPNKEIYMVKKIVKKITGNSSKLNCRGGTSDSRFLGSIPRLELGLRNNTIHMVDERTSISDLKKLTKIYYNILENYF